jgi:hypothetical protein
MRLQLPLYVAIIALIHVAIYIYITDTSAGWLPIILMPFNHNVYSNVVVCHRLDGDISYWHVFEATRTLDGDVFMVL